MTLTDEKQITSSCGRYDGSLEAAVIDLGWRQASVQDAVSKRCLYCHIHATKAPFSCHVPGSRDPALSSTGHVLPAS